MNEFKKRLRMLARRGGSAIDFPRDGGFRFTKDDAAIQFNRKSKRCLLCSALDIDDSWQFEIPKEFVFDVFLLFQDARLRRRLKNYVPSRLVTLQDFFDEEDGKRAIDELQKRLTTRAIDFEMVGGNRILVEYREGVLIIVDDLIGASANVVEFAAAIGR